MNNIFKTLLSVIKIKRVNRIYQRCRISILMNLHQHLNNASEISFSHHLNSINLYGYVAQNLEEKIKIYFRRVL